MQAWRADKGFSLVEVLMVIAIIGLMTTAVVLVMPGANRQADEAVGRTERAMIALSRQAVLTGQVFGVRFSDQGFVAMELTDEGWAPRADLLKPEALSFAPLALTALSVAGADVVLGGTDAGAQVWFLPTGERPEAVLTFTSPKGESLTLTIGEDGTTGIARHG